jgi:type VI protein secretion system component Hcp
VPVDSYAFDLNNPLDIAGTTALASAFRFSARSGQASPELQSALVEGRTFATVNVVAVRQTMAGKLEEFARWKLSHAQVVSYATDSLLADTFEVSFGVLEYTFGVASTKKGAPPPVTGRWDLQATGSEVATRGPVVPDAVIPPDVRVLMQVPGVVGASQLVGYQGWIPLEAAGLTLARQSTPSQDVVLVSSFGVATSAGLHSPLVIDALARQHVYADDAPVRIVTLNTRDQDNIYETARWTLSDAQFTYYANHDLRQDGFAVAYDAWELEYKPTTSQGAAGAPIQLALDVDGTGTRLASAGAPLAAAASTEIKLFLKVPGIAGDSLRAGYVGWIQVSGAQFGIEQLWGAEASSWATPLFLELPTGLSAPRLMAAAANGMHVSYVELAAVHDSSSFEMARLRLDDIQWIHFVTRDARHDIVALTYDRLTLTWNNADPVTGIPSTTTEGQWPATIGDPLRSADPWAGQSEAESSTLTSTAGLSDATARDEARGWTAAGVQMVDGQYRHRFLRSGETITIINDAPWQNPINPLDANGDGVVSPRDALLIMNHLQADGPGPLAADGPAWDAPLRYLDVTGSRELESAYVSPLDALRILNALNSPQDAEGELAAAPIAQDTPFVPADVTGRSSRSFGLKRALVARPSDAIHDVAWPPAADAVPDWLVAPLVDAHAGTDERAQQARRTDAALLDLWDEAWSDEA